MNEPEILADSAPLVTYGNRTLAMFARTWVDKNGQQRNVIALCEVVPARTERGAGGVVVKSWRRAYKGVNLQLDDLDAWRRFNEELNAAVSGRRQERLTNAKPKRGPVAAEPGLEGLDGLSTG